MLKLNRVLICLVVLSGLAGCAISPDGRLAGSGSASYEYERVLADGSSCKISLLSGRDVIGGALQIDSNCGVISSADSTRGVADALTVINSSIQTAREAISKVP